LMAHFVIIQFCIGVEMLDYEFRVLVRTMIRQKKVIDRQPKPHLVMRRVKLDTQKKR
jgi:hypothetical protein